MLRSAAGAGYCRREFSALSETNVIDPPGSFLPHPRGTAGSESGVVARLGPVLTAAVMFSVSDVFAKLALEGGTDTLTLLSSRTVVGIALVFMWLRFNRAGVPLTPRAKWVSLGLGVLLTANLLGVFEGIALMPVSIAILTYFVYPLITGLLGAATALDRLTWRGAATAVAAFGGLTLIVGANPVELAPLGVAAALVGALCRSAMLLITRAALEAADARLVTWYTLWSSLALFATLSLAASDWRWPYGTTAWTAFIGLGFSTTAAIFALYVSTQRIGPFRTALYMNLEPFLTAVAGALVLGDRLTPVQIGGGTVMLAALTFFQILR
jgi:probable blue pigment (indigoidine) exporter